MLNITKIEITKEIERQKFNSLFYSVVGGDEGVFINEQRGEEHALMALAKLDKLIDSIEGLKTLNWYSR